MESRLQTLGAVTEYDGDVMGLKHMADVGHSEPQSGQLCCT
jgi:hypothetical protein